MAVMPKRIPECRLCGYAHWSYQPHKLIGGPEPSKAVKALVKDTVTVATGPMTEADARELTERIRRTQDDWCRLVYEAHEREAWRAMGYKGWLEYVYAELPMGRSRAYQLLAHAKITLALGVGPNFHNVELSPAPPEAQTRSLSSPARRRILEAAKAGPQQAQQQLAAEIATEAEPCDHTRVKCADCGAML